MYQERISIDPRICFGKPCVKGTRIPAFMVLQLIEQGLSPADIIKDCYPDLTVEDIKACAKALGTAPGSTGT